MSFLRAYKKLYFGDTIVLYIKLPEASSFLKMFYLKQGIYNVSTGYLMLVI